MSESTHLRYQLALILIILLAFILRLRTLDLNPLWFDEAMEYWVATAPIDNLFSTVHESLQDPPYYSLLLHFWLNLGRDEFTLRLLSTFASLLSVATIFTLGKHAYNQSTGLIAALILAVLPPDIRFAQEVGQYAVLVLSLLLNLLAMSYARQTNHWKYWLAWLITGIVCVYNYYGSLLIISAVVGTLFVENFMKGKSAYLKKQIIISFIFIATILPLILFWVPDQLFRGPTQSAFRLTLNSPAVEISTFLTKTSLVLAYQLTGFIFEPAMWANLQRFAWLLLLMALFFCFYSLTKTRKYLYVVVWLITSWVVYYVVGRLGAYPYGGTRHALILTPLLILCVSIGIASMWRIRRVLGLVMLGSLALVTIISPREVPEDLRTITQHYLAQQKANIPTYIYYGAVPGFRYQLQVQTDMEEEITGAWYRACFVGEAQPDCVQNNIFYGRWLRPFSPEERANEILSVVGPAAEAEFWLIFSHTSDAERDELLQILQNTHRITDDIQASGASAYLLQKQ